MSSEMPEAVGGSADERSRTGVEPREPHYLQRELFERLRQDPQLLDFLIEGVHDGFWYWDLDHPEHEWMSPRFWTTLGYDPDAREHLASEWQELIHPDDLEAALENSRRHFEDPRQPYDQLVRYRCRRGEWKWIRCRGVAVRDDGGTPRRMLGAHTDVTEARNALFLRRSNEGLRENARILAHDLRQPLRAINSFLPLLRESLGDLTDQQQRYFGFLEDAGELLGQQLEGLLEITRLESAKDVFETVSGREVAESAKRQLRSELERLGGEIVIQDLPDLWGSRALLHSVFLNLFQNSLRFRSEAAPRIEVSALPKGQTSCRLAIVDNGIGIAPQFHSAVFELFRQLDPQADRHGVGIGLALVKRIVDLHEGAVWIEGDAGAGATVVLELPTADAVYRPAGPGGEQR